MLRTRLGVRRTALLSCLPFCIGFVTTRAYAGEKPGWTAINSAIYQQKGTYPPTVNVRLFWNACILDDKGQPNPPNQLGQYYGITVTGAGVTASQPVVDGCSLATTLTISSSAAPGLQALNVIKYASASDKVGAGNGFAQIAFMDATAGPVPANPQVDVLWEVLTDALCKDNFGNHMPGHLFCVDVKIGNNSGHALQLAGMGFTRKSLQCIEPKAENAQKHDCTGSPQEGISIPNVSYQIARASEQYGSQVTARNIIANSVQALGLLMVSFTPFFENSFSKSRWSTGAAIVGTGFTQVINTVAPDLTVRELQNLDDQAFRDGKLIPNNTQVRMLVFVQKKSLAEAIGAVVPQIQAANLVHNCTTPPTGYKKAKGASNDCYPKWEDSFGDCLKKLDCNPVVVKLALGRMVIIGDSIEYIQRVVVDSNVTSQEVPAGNSTANALPTVTKATLQTSGTPTGTLTGTNLENVDKLSIACPDPDATKSVASTEVSSSMQSSSAQLTFNLPTGKALTAGVQCTLTLTTKSGQTVTQPATAEAPK